MSSEFFRQPRLFKTVDAPRGALACLHAGEVALLARLDDDELESIGLTADAVVAGIEGAQQFLDAERSLIESIWESVRAGSIEWIANLAELLPDDEGWRDFVALHWCLDNPFFDEPNLAYGSLGTLTDTLLEIAKLQATVNDVHGYYASFAESIAAGKLSGTEDGLVFAGTVLAGGVVRFFTAGVGAFAMGRAAGWVDSKLKNVDGWVMELALECVVASTVELTHPEIHQAIARKIFDEARGVTDRESGSSSDKQLRMLLSAFRGLTADTPLEDHENGVAMPDLEGQTVKQAKLYLSASGLAVPRLIDQGNPEEPRWIMNEAAWVVRGQRPVAGTLLTDHMTPIVLAFSRPGEKIRAPRMEKDLDDAVPRSNQ